MTKQQHRISGLWEYGIFAVFNSLFLFVTALAVFNHTAIGWMKFLVILNLLVTFLIDLVFHSYYKSGKPLYPNASDTRTISAFIDFVLVCLMVFGGFFGSAVLQCISMHLERRKYHWLEKIPRRPLDD